MREYRILDGQKTPVEDQIGFDVRPYLTKVSFKPGEHLFGRAARRNTFTTWIRAGPR